MVEGLGVVAGDRGMAKQVAGGEENRRGLVLLSSWDRMPTDIDRHMRFCSW